MHEAAIDGEDAIVAGMLTAAHARSPRLLADLVADLDRFNRTADHVCLTDRCACLVAAAGKGTSPAESGCPVSHVGWRLRRPDTWSSPAPAADPTDAGAAPDTQAPASAAEEGTGGAGGKEGGCDEDGEGTSGCAVGRKPVETEGGWRSYGSGLPPLAKNASDLARCDITEVRGAVDSATFIKDFHSIRRPTMFRGAAADWVAKAKWTKDYIRRKMGGLSSQCGVIPYAHLDGLKSETMTIADYLDLDQSQRPGNGEVPLYIFNTTLIDGAGLKGDLKWPAMFGGFGPANCQTVGGQDCSQNANQFLMGPEASGAPMHFHAPAFNAALVGRKRWFIVPPPRVFWSRMPISQWYREEPFNFTPTWVNSISFGSPHVRCTPMWALSTCGA